MLGRNRVNFRKKVVGGSKEIKFFLRILTNSKKFKKFWARENNLRGVFFSFYLFEQLLLFLFYSYSKWFFELDSTNFLYSCCVFILVPFKNT